MNDNLHTIFSSSECPSHDILTGYFRRSLPEEEMLRVEQHLVDCEMCSDELEGMSRMKNPGDLDLIVEELTAKITRKQSRLLSLTRSYSLIAAAAVLILVIGSMVIIRLLTRTEDTEMTALTEEALLPGKDSAAVPPSLRDRKSLAQATVTDAIEREKTQTAVPPDKAPVAPVEEATETEATVTALDTAEQTELKTTSGEAAADAVETPAFDDSAEPTPVTVTHFAPLLNNSGDKKKTMATGPPIAGLGNAAGMESAITAFNDGNYELAASIFGQLAAQQPENYKAAYYLAGSYFRMKQYDLAARALSPILEDQRHDYYKEASLLSDSIKLVKDR